MRQRGTDQDHLRGGGQVAVHVVDLLLETWTQKADRKLDAGQVFQSGG